MRSIFIALTICFLSACITMQAQENLVVKRAAFDLDCNIESIRLSELGDKSFGAYGCGRKAAYLIVCNATENDIDYASSCKAVLNSHASRKESSIKL